MSWPPTWLTPIPDDAESRGAEVAEFIESFVTLTKDSVAGSVGHPIKLDYWQKELLRQSFILDEDGLFKHRTIYWGMGRKNGKSSLATGIGLWSLFMHDEGGETYSCAATKDQARITFNDARKLIEANPDLNSMTKVYRDAIELPATGSVWRVLASESFGAEGLNASCVIFDEIHALPDRKMWDVMQLSMASRKQPLMIATTTAGTKSDSTGNDSTAFGLYNHLKRVATQETPDPSFFGAWWEAPPEADHRTEEAWKAGNPGYGILNSPEDFKSMVARTPEAEFRTKRCNQWVSSQNSWLPTGTWDSCEAELDLTDKDYVIGFDGSFNGDSTVLVGATIEDEPQVFMIKAWEKDPNIHDDLWRVDILEVENTIRKFVRDNPRVKEIACDPYRWQRSMEVLAEEGYPISEYASTNARRMVPACAKFMDAVVEGRLKHDGNPLLARHLSNAAVKVDNLGPRIVKENRHSSRRIDAAVAAVIAVDRALSSRIEEEVLTPGVFVF
jgi:phage terminase large subunit-like protein